MHGNEGSMHVLKVVINIRNRGNFIVNNVRVMDKVPETINAPTQYGSLRPNFVKSQGGFTTMIWDIHAIPRGQERIISYRLVGKLNILNRVILPQAKASCTSMGRKLFTSSSSVSLKGKKETL